jgi:hypothetical protein
MKMDKRLVSVLILAVRAAAQSTAIGMPAGVTGVAYRNGCSSGCALLIMLHGIGGSGPNFAGCHDAQPLHWHDCLPKCVVGNSSRAP